MPKPDAADELAAIHDEIFQRTPQAPPAAPIETRQEEKVFDLSEFAAEEMAPEPKAAPGGPRVYDLNEFGAAEL